MSGAPPPPPAAEPDPAWSLSGLPASGLRGEVRGTTVGAGEGLPRVGAGGLAGCKRVTRCGWPPGRGGAATMPLAVVLLREPPAQLRTSWGSQAAVSQGAEMSSSSHEKSCKAQTTNSNLDSVLAQPDQSQLQRANTACMK